MNEKSTTVILAEAQNDFGGSLKPFLELRGIQVLECTDGIEAVRQSFSKNPDLIILDVTLPRLNGYLGTRVLKNNALMRETPIIHISTSSNSIERYWSTACGGDGHLQIPVNEAELNRLLKQFSKKGNTSGKRRLLSPVRMITDLEDQAIFNLSTNLLDPELLRANILHEINLMDVSSMPTNDFIGAIMATIGSFYDFSLGAAVMFFEPNGEFFFCQNGQPEQHRLDEVKRMVLKHLEQQHDQFYTPEQFQQSIIPTRIPSLLAVNRKISISTPNKEDSPDARWRL